LPGLAALSLALSACGCSSYLRALGRDNFSTVIRQLSALETAENFPLPVVLEFWVFGHGVLTIQETGKADQARPDDKVLAFATRENSAILTLNL
jgi:hypothetical protein